MISEASKEHIENLTDFCWNVYQDPSKRTTPPYHTREELFNSLERQFNTPRHHIWTFHENETLQAVLCLDINHEIAYVQSIGGPYIYDSEQYPRIASAFLRRLETLCADYECYFGLPKTNRHGRNFLESEGFICVDDTVQMRVCACTFKPIFRDFNVCALSTPSFEDYKSFHDLHYVGYYWDAHKLFNDLDRWHVYLAYEGSTIIGSTFALPQTQNSGEIYGTTVLQNYENTSLRAELLSAVTRACFEGGVTEVLNFVPEGVESDAALSCGYEMYDTYMAYHKKHI